LLFIVVQQTNEINRSRIRYWTALPRIASLSFTRSDALPNSRC